jgi:hypothetical protein
MSARKGSEKETSPLDVSDNRTAAEILLGARLTERQQNSDDRYHSDQKHTCLLPKSSHGRRQGIAMPGTNRPAHSLPDSPLVCNSYLGVFGEGRKD